MKVYLIAHTAAPEKLVAAAAKLCYAKSGAGELMGGMTDTKAQEFVEMLASMGHESPTEHVSFTFAIEGVSRALLAQITRHRIASFSVQSQRYVDLKEFAYITPPAIANNPAAAARFAQSMQRDLEDYIAITEALEQEYLKQYIAEGMNDKAAKTKANKQAIEDARFVLPNACETKMMVTMNTRSLQNFFRHRCCQRAQWEIRALADEMLKLASEAAPSLFVGSGPGCVGGPCPEGKMSCGRGAEMRARYAALKAGSQP